VNLIIAGFIVFLLLGAIIVLKIAESGDIDL
jgi:hypothetical protein